ADAGIVWRSRKRASLNNQTNTDRAAWLSRYGAVRLNPQGRDIMTGKFFVASAIAVALLIAAAQTAQAQTPRPAVADTSAAPPMGPAPPPSGPVLSLKQGKV